MPNTPKTQTTIFNSGDPRQAFFAELSNALYDKTVQELAEDQRLDILTVRQRLLSLNHHVNSVTEKLLNGNTPLELDIHNGSWQSKQLASCRYNLNHDATTKWLLKNMEMAQALPIYVGQKHKEFFELDSIDKIESNSKGQQRIRMNKHGWFLLSGERDTEQAQKASDADYLTRHLLKPTKAIMSAACCGHCWNYRNRTSPRRLSLRELFLTTTINWKNYKLLAVE